MTQEDELDRFAARAFDFALVREVLEQHALTGLGRRALRELRVGDEARTRARIARSREMTILSKARDLPSLAGISDLSEALQLARERTRSLEEAEIVALRAFCASVERLADWLRARREDVPALGELGGELPELGALREAIDRVVDPRGKVRDDASPLLKRLRREELDLSASIDRVLKQMLRRPELRPVLGDGSVHRRSGRSVLAVKAKSSGRVRGIVHDRSQTEQTVFVEPQEVIEAGNRLATCRADMRNELARILLELTREALKLAPDLARAMDLLGELELAVISVGYAEATEGRVALLPGETGAAQGLLLRRARHPLLLDQVARGDLDEVVPIDLRLGDPFDMVIITGPNTGGKTLALKTAGLFTLLTRLGFAVPCAEGTTVPLFEGVVADIGDEQEIRQSLSTFSSHLVRIRDGLARATPRTLVLLDELGGGTDPDEGAALGEALLEHLLKRGVPTLASTHLGKLKEFAFRHGRVENACVEFDAVSLRPLYHILVGTPGESGALVIAERLGLPAEIVAAARGRLERRDGELVKLMEDVRDARTQAERVRSQAEESLEDAARKKREIEEQQEELHRRGELLEAEAQRGLEERVREARRGLELARSLLDQLPGPGRDVMAEALQGIEDDLTSASMTDRREAFLETLSKGKLVYLPRYRQRCLVHKVDRERREVTIKLGSMKMKVAFDEVTWYESL